MALFFQTLENPDDLANAFKAYKQALSDSSEAKNNPDLHHNIATVGGDPGYGLLILTGTYV